MSMDKFDSPEYLRERAEGLRKIALENVGQYAQSLRKYAEELYAKAAHIEAQGGDTPSGSSERRTPG
jgi:hypothetical protein